MRAPTRSSPRSGDLAGFEVTEVEGLRATDPTRTLCDLGAVCDVDTVERALESALRRGITSVSRLECRCAALGRKGRAGTKVLRAAMARRADQASPTESDLETLYLQVLRDHGVPLPERQYRVVHHGRFLGRLDMAYPPAKVFVELDGWASHSSRQAFHHDRLSQNDFVAAGWSPLRFTWRDVHDRPAETAERTLEVLTRAPDRRAAAGR